MLGSRGMKYYLYFKRGNIATLFSAFRHLWGEYYFACVRPFECFELFRGFQYRLIQV